MVTWANVSVCTFVTDLCGLPTSPSADTAYMKAVGAGWGRWEGGLGFWPPSLKRCPVADTPLMKFIKGEFPNLKEAKTHTSTRTCTHACTHARKQEKKTCLVCIWRFSSLPQVALLSLGWHDLSAENLGWLWPTAAASLSLRLVPRVPASGNETVVELICRCGAMWALANSWAVGALYFWFSFCQAPELKYGR